MSFTRLKQLLGVDRAIGATTATQLMRFVTGPITMLLIIKYLTPADQGFYYAFAGVAGIQVFLEAGFAVSIAQFTAKEFAGLRFTKGGFLTGKSENLSRLRSIYQKAFRYYSAMAAVLMISLGVGGYFFFSTKPAEGVSWQTPWIIVSICAGLQFLLTPFWSILEGCNRVADVATYRLAATIIGFVAGAAGLYLTSSIWFAVFASVASLIFAYSYIFWKWSALRAQVRRMYRQHYQINWLKEVWGFQWRNALAWVGGFLLSSAIPVAAFQLYGAVAAGQIGMTMQVTRIGCGLASSWTATKIPQLGILYTNGKVDEFHRYWLAGAARHVLVAFVYQLIFIFGLWILSCLYPLISTRFANIAGSAAIAVGTSAASIVLIYAHYFRAIRQERFMEINMGMGIGCIIGGIVLFPILNENSLSFSFALVHVVAAGLSILIWHTHKYKTPPTLS